MNRLPDFSQMSVAVFGDVMLDRYWDGQTSRISPEAPVPIVHINPSKTKECLGGAGNVALNMVALGAKVSLFGLCGFDQAGDILEQQLCSRGIDTHLFRVKDLPTVTKLRILSLQQQMLRLDFEEVFANADHSELLNDFLAHLENNRPDMIILSDYAKGTLANPQLLIQAARRLNIPVLVDPKRQDFSAYHGAALITPNFKEFEAVVGTCADEAAINARGMGLINDHDLEGLLITRGAEGMTLLRRHQPPLHLHAKAREVYDVTGAGDTVVAVFAAALACKTSWDFATVLANTAAAIVVGKVGAANVTREELASELKATLHPPSASKIIPLKAAANLMALGHAAGEKIALFAEHFDLLTVDILERLRAAKSAGHQLMVAISTDETISQITGAPPIHPLEARISVIAALRVVDWVFAGTTQEIAHLLPDILCVEQPLVIG